MLDFYEGELLRRTVLVRNSLRRAVVDGAVEDAYLLFGKDAKAKRIAAEQAARLAEKRAEQEYLASLASDQDHDDFYAATTQAQVSDYDYDGGCDEEDYVFESEKLVLPAPVPVPVLPALDDDDSSSSSSEEDEAAVVLADAPLSSVKDGEHVWFDDLLDEVSVDDEALARQLHHSDNVSDRSHSPLLLEQRQTLRRGPHVTPTHRSPATPADCDCPSLTDDDDDSSTDDDEREEDEQSNRSQSFFSNRNRPSLSSSKEIKPFNPSHALSLTLARTNITNSYNDDV